MIGLVQRFWQWKAAALLRKHHTTMERLPFYDIVRPYLPKDRSALIVDIGAGQGEFVSHLDLTHSYVGVHLLDGNPSTVSELKAAGLNATVYRAPERLPFEDQSVGLIHCSHMIEHLYHEELYAFLKELDRVLSQNGILVISTPLLWRNFYADLSHIKPYSSGILVSYLCQPEQQNTARSISQNFTVKELVYRYTHVGMSEWRADSLTVDFFLQALKKCINFLGINKYTRNGYTLILQKDGPKQL